jgi:hypothetical protein
MLVLVPQTTWERIASAQWNSLAIFMVSFLPLLGLTAAIEGLGMFYLGASINDYGRTIEVTKEQVIQFQVVQFAFSLIILGLGTKLVLWVSNGFHSPTTFRQAFTLTAYAITPLLWLRIIDGHPAIPTWVCFGVGAVGIIFTMYHGIAFVLQPDTSVGFGLYLICSIVLILLAGLSHFIVQIVAERKFNFASLLSEPNVALVERLF